MAIAASAAKQPGLLFRGNMILRTKYGAWTYGNTWFLRPSWVLITTYSTYIVCPPVVAVREYPNYTPNIVPDTMPRHHLKQRSYIIRSVQCKPAWYSCCVVYRWAEYCLCSTSEYNLFAVRITWCKYWMRPPVLQKPLRKWPLFLVK